MAFWTCSNRAIKRSNCFNKEGDDSPCHVNSNPYMIMFGVAEIVLSQIPDFDQISWLSILAAIMSFTYSSIGLVLGIVQVIRKPVYLSAVLFDSSLGLSPCRLKFSAGVDRKRRN